MSVRETERVEIFLEIAEARIIGIIVPGAVHHLRMMRIHRPNHVVVKILDVRSSVGRGFIPNAVSIGGRKILHQLDEILQKSLVGRAPALRRDFCIIID